MSIEWPPYAKDDLDRRMLEEIWGKKDVQWVEVEPEHRHCSRDRLHPATGYWTYAGRPPGPARERWNHSFMNLGQGMADVNYLVHYAKPTPNISMGFLRGIGWFCRIDDPDVEGGASYSDADPEKETLGAAICRALLDWNTKHPLRGRR